MKLEIGWATGEKKEGCEEEAEEDNEDEADSEHSISLIE